MSGGYQGNLGHGFQTALGVKLATVVHYQIGVVLFIFNNNSYGDVRRDQIIFFDGNVVGSELVNPDLFT